MRCSVILGAATATVIATAVSIFAYESVAFTDNSAIKGKVVYSGPLVARKTIIPTKDKDVCGVGTREVEQIMLGPDGAVQNALVYLEDITKGKPWEDRTKTPAIENRGCDFQPQLQIVRAGDIEIVNSDPILHNTHGFLEGRTVFNVALPHKGVRIKKLLREPGIVRVRPRQTSMSMPT